MRSIEQIKADSIREDADTLIDSIRECEQSLRDLASLRRFFDARLAAKRAELAEVVDKCSESGHRWEERPNYTPDAILYGCSTCRATKSEEA